MYVEGILGEYQGGFRKRRSTAIRNPTDNGESSGI